MTKLVYKQIQQLNYKKRQRVAMKLHAVLLFDFFVCFPDYFTSSKINAIECQKDKYLMVQIWFLKFIKSILDVILN